MVMCKICAKAGYRWFLGLLMLVPIANIALGFYVAFAKWPIEQRLESLGVSQHPTEQSRISQD